MRIVPPDAAKMAYEKAEISGANIIHFKNLSDEPNGIHIQNGRSPKISGIIKQSQLSDAIFNKKKIFNTVAIWNKLYTKTTYLVAISFLGEKRYKEHCLTGTVGFRKVCPTRYALQLHE